MRSLLRAGVLATMLAVSPAGNPAELLAQPPATNAAEGVGIAALLTGVESAVRSGAAPAYLALLAPDADLARASGFAAFELGAGVSRAVVRERDRGPLKGSQPGSSYRLVVDVFTEFGARARVATWQIDVRRQPDGGWRIADQDRLSAVDNLHRLRVDPLQQFAARNFVVRAEDLLLTLVDGTVFIVSTDQGVTGLLLLGRGDMQFSPRPDTEKGQIKIFSGSEVLETGFDAAFVRVRDIAPHADLAALVAQPVNPRELRRAEELFREESTKTFVLELADLSAETWWLLPGEGDFVAEVHTSRFETLTYARSRSEPEDVSLFNRQRRRNISIYASPEKVNSRGRFYNEDDLASYDVLDYDIDVSVAPERQLLEGRARMRLRLQTDYANQITIRLAEPLTVHSVTSDRHGRLFNLRVRNQNTLLVNLPTGLPGGDELTLLIVYSGRLAPQPPDRETLVLQGQDGAAAERPLEMFVARAEPSFLYSNRSYWYPQAPITDYATATIRVSVPATMSCVASGEMMSDSPTLQQGPAGTPPRKQYVFEASRPVRYFAFVVGRMVRADRVTIAFEDPQDGNAASSRGPLIGGAVFDTLDLTVEAHPLQVSRGRQLVNRAADIARFYQSVVGDSPYRTFTVALVENALPGGHSPGYFALLNQPLPNTPVVWRTDPAHFEGFPEFFLAHEMAHQWWGQAVGWRNYHEQWLSEGFAQYFSAMYAEHALGGEAFAKVLEQMRRWAIRESDQGPVYLGYRLGHVRNDSRVFRALVYNKGAAVLHMLRQLLGDDAFFRGLRRFYVGARYMKVGTEDLRFAMEAESGRKLERFFERWIYGSTLPRLAFAYEVRPAAADQKNAAGELVLRFTQDGELFDLPVVVTVEYRDRTRVDVVVPVTERVVEHRVPLAQPLRSATIRDDRGILVEID